jgi:hypothetical protein
MKEPTMQTIEITREIKWVPEEREYDCYLNGQYVGSRRLQVDAELLLDDAVARLLKGMGRTA